MEFAIEKELEMLQGGRYDLPDWEGKDEGNEADEEDEQIESMKIEDDFKLDF